MPDFAEHQSTDQRNDGVLNQTIKPRTGPDGPPPRIGLTFTWQSGPYSSELHLGHDV